MDVALGRHQFANAGPCAIDLEGDNSVPHFMGGRGEEPEIVVERMILDADGRMVALGPGRDIPIYHQVPRGYMFDI